jgi:hypothetical protein
VSAARRCALSATVIAVSVLPLAIARADSFTPVRLTVTGPPVARLDIPLMITVRVSADAGVLDVATAPLRVRVKLASECGGTFTTTDGVTLLDSRLVPQPNTGRAYAASARGAGTPTSFGVKTLCTYLEEEGDSRMFASATSTHVDVSRACTRAAARYDSVRRSRRRAATKVAFRVALRACKSTRQL